MADSRLPADKCTVTFGLTKPRLERCCYVWTLEKFADLGTEEEAASGSEEEDLGSEDDTSMIHSSWFSALKSKCCWRLNLCPYDKTEVNQRVVVDLGIKERPVNLVSFNGSCKFMNSQDEIIDNGNTLSGCNTFTGCNKDYSSFIICSIGRKRLLSMLEDDVLKIRVEITAILREPTSDFTQSPLEDRLSYDTLAMFKSGEFSDFTIVVEEDSFPVHKFILAARSPVFKTMFKTDSCEKCGNTMDMQGFEVDTVEVLLDFLYSGKLGDVSVPMAIDLLRAADMYQIDDLIRHSVHKLLSNINIGNVIEICLAAERYNASELREVCFRFAVDNKEKVELPQEQGDWMEHFNTSILSSVFDQL